MIEKLIELPFAGGGGYSLAQSDELFSDAPEKGVI